MVFIATEHDQLYAFDVNSGQQLWRANYLASSNPSIQISSVSSNDVNCEDLVPEIGITATPVIDASTKTMYLVTKTKEYNTFTRTTTFYQTLHAVDVTTGKDKVPYKRIAATAPGNGNGSVGGILTFDPLVEGLRGSLLIVRGQVIIAWASHCDLGTYHGWLMAYNESNLAQTAVLVDTPNGYEGGFWGGGAGVATDLSGGHLCRYRQREHSISTAAAPITATAFCKARSIPATASPCSTTSLPGTSRPWTTTTPIWAPAAWFCCLTSRARPIPTC